MSPPDAPLCRFDGHTCAACCRGEAVPETVLRVRLRRQARLFHQWFSPVKPPLRRHLALYEIAARGGLDLFLAVLLLLPGVGDWLRPRLKRRLVCAFLGFEDAEEKRVGCLLHPTRWGGREVRPAAAFALLPGLGCGAPDYLCLAALWFARAHPLERRRFGRRVAGMDWHRFSRAAAAFRPVRRQSRPHTSGGSRL